MNTEIFTLKHFNNTLDMYATTKKLYESKWFMDFGKFGSEIFTSDGKIVYSVIKKFQFWKWKMVFTIKNQQGNFYQLISQNNRNTVYAIDFDGMRYEIKSHFNKKTSIFKNDEKIAEFDTTFSQEKDTNTIQLQLASTKDTEVCFLLFSCFKIGDTAQSSKAILTSQKQLEPNDEPWF